MKSAFSRIIFASLCLLNGKQITSFPLPALSKQGKDVGLLMEELGKLKPVFIYMADADLRHVDLKGKDLGGIWFNKADLSYADVRYANLKRAHAQEAIWLSAKCQNANMIGIVLSQAVLDKAHFDFAN